MRYRYQREQEKEALPEPRDEENASSTDAIQ